MCSINNIDKHDFNIMIADNTGFVHPLFKSSQIYLKSDT